MTSSLVLRKTVFLLLILTLLPSTGALFNFGVDLFPDLKSQAPLGGGPVSLSCDVTG